MTNNSQGNVYVTSDLGCAAALVCMGYKIESMERVSDNKVQFCFPAGYDIEAFAVSYWDGDLKVNAREYFDSLKMLKSRVYST